MNIEAFFKMTYGLYLVSSKHNNQISGYIANTAFQVTAEPPQIAISCHKENISAKVIEDSGVFSVSVLEKETDAGLIGLFGYHSGNEDEKFEKVNYKFGKTGTPIVLTNAVAWFECKVIDKFDVGSHFLFIGEVLKSELLEPQKDPLTYDYFRNEMKLAAPERAPTYVDKTKIQSKKTEAEEETKPEVNLNFICPICAYVYEPDKGDDTQGIAPGTPFADLSEDWICPICAAAKSEFISEN